MGRHLAHELSRQQHRLTILSRNRERHKELLVLPTTVVLNGDVHDPRTLEKRFAGMDVVINLIGILNESGSMTFKKAHIELPQKIVHACVQAKVKQLLHVSALNASAQGPSQYLSTKYQGEKIVQDAASRIKTTIFRPSLIYGPGDGLFTRFAQLLKKIPGVFPLACASVRVQPVYVKDVVRAIDHALHSQPCHGKALHLCGPNTYTLRDIVDYVNRLLQLNRTIINLGPQLSLIQATLLGHMPGKLFTVDNYRSLQVNKICNKDEISDLTGIAPTAFEDIVPQYLLP